MTVTLAPASYVKRFKMEVELRDLPEPTPLPTGHSWVPWRPDLLDVHAEVLFLCFRREIDAEVFPSFGDRSGCGCLMTEMSRKTSFLPAATWLLAGPFGYVGTVQGLKEHGVGAIQNLGVLPSMRDRGCGTALLLQALHGFRRSGLARGMLEVTARNESAVRLYRMLGFRSRKTVYKSIARPMDFSDCVCL